MDADMGVEPMLSVYETDDLTVCPVCNMEQLGSSILVPLNRGFGCATTRRWHGMMDLNHRMAESKSAAVPLG